MTAVALATALGLPVLGGCSSAPAGPRIVASEAVVGPRTGTADGRPDTSTKVGTGQLRTDLEPLTKRFGALGRPVSATWMSGTLRSGSPGPSTYWIDAVVQLAPDSAAVLRAASPAPTPSGDAPDVEAGLRASLPSGPLLRSQTLDALFAEGSFRARAYLAADSDTVVLVARGQ
ncbi:hypothetical protein [Terrabacter carboxydivorans]